MNPKIPWLVLYIFSNIYAFIFIINSGELIGDVKGIPSLSNSLLIWAALLVILSYFAISVFFFKIISKIKIRPIRFGMGESLLGQRIGVMMIFLQSAFLVFNLSTGVNIGGSRLTNTTDSPLALLWVLIPVDRLFFVYYGTYRENKFFYPNLIVFLVSQISRGWVGSLMVVIFFEWCWAFYKKRISAPKVLAGCIAMAILYPLLTNLKWIVRGYAAKDFTLDVILDGFSRYFDSGDYFSLIGAGFHHLISRLQFTSLTVEVIRLRDVLQAGFSDGAFLPFWKEGIHGLLFDRLFHGIRPMTVSVAFTMYENFPERVIDVGSYNISLGFVSWFFIAPHWAPLYIAYTLLLCFLSRYLLVKIGASKLAEDMLWFFWVGLLLAAWLFVFVTFIHCLFLFLLLKIILSRIPSIRFQSRLMHPRVSP